MERINAWTDLTSPDGDFRYGSLVGGEAPTPLKAEWLNMVQAEMVNLILAVLPALDSNDRTQLLKSVRMLVSNAAYTKPQIDAFLAAKANWAITLGGYGITDAYTKSATDALLAVRAPKGTTLAEYGIADAYTRAQTDALLVQKAALATTLAGYGIVDAFTKTEIATLLAVKQDKNTASFGSASWERDSATGGLTQYGRFNMLSGANEQTITFPTVFPTACRSVVLTNYEDASPAENNIVRILRWTTSTVTILNSGGNTATEYSWMAKGN
jgi:phage-related tail fiber protein